MVTVEVPFPVSVNKYYRHVHGFRTLISREGRAYRERVCAILRRSGVRPLDGPLAVGIALYPPDRRVRDVDNTLKSLFDALQHGGMFHNDSQVKKLLVIMQNQVVPGGKAVVVVAAFDPSTIKEITHEITA